MTTYSQYQPTAIALDSGLDFITPKVVVNGGSLSGCFNFERTDRNGYSRIYGYEPYDGSANASLAYTNSVYLTHAVPTHAPLALEALRIAGREKILGIVVSTTSTKSLIIVYDFDEWRLVLTAVNAGNTISLEVPSTNRAITVSAIVSFEEGYTPTGDAKALTLAKNTYYKQMAANVTYPGAAINPIIGLHGFKDDLYAVKDLQMVYFNSSTTDQIYPNVYTTSLDPANEPFYIANVRLLHGDWATSDAEGILEIITLAGILPSNGAYSADGAAFTLVDMPADQHVTNAGLWKTTSFLDTPYTGGWEDVHLGFEINFEDGTAYGPFRAARRGKFSNFTTDVATADGHGTTGSTTNASGTGGQVTGTWSITPAGNVPASVNNETGTVNRAKCTLTGTVAPVNIPHIDLGALDIPDISSIAGAEVRGVEVVIRRVNRAVPSFSGYLSVAAHLQTSGTDITGASVYELEIPPNDFNGTTVFGGPEDLWGLDAAGMKAVLDPSTLGLRMDVTMQPSSSGSSNTNVLELYDVKVRVYFTQQVTQYYFYDGVDDVTADVTYAFVTSTDDNAWEEGASGTLQVTNIQPHGAATRTYIKDGDQVWTGPLGTGLQIATMSSEMVYNGLDTLAELEEASSRYSFINSNFFADEDFEGMYGVSGAGRAFAYDGFYFTRIFTQSDATKDKPRHIASHQFHLALGYRAGAVLLSVTGNPLDFLGLDGGVEIDTGDPVTGFARMQGTTLGIFCKDSIQGLVGTSADNFALNMLNPYEGAIEFTVGDIGRPVYCSYRGISFFEQSAAYGDFEGQRLSYMISPWLLPRLSGATNPLGVANATAGPTTAYVVRSKNQYRLQFGDGYRLTMTLVGPEQQPMFTIQADSLYDEDGLFLGYFTPRAETSFVDSVGKEHIYLSHYSESVPLDEYYAYEMEKSWTYNGVGIPAYIISNENFLGTPYNYDNPRKIRLHGLSLGYAPIKVRVDKDYNKNNLLYTTDRESVPTSLPIEPAETLSYDYNPVTSMAQIAARGRSFSMRFMSYDPDNQPAYITDPVYADVCPPFVLQALMLQYTENKGDE